jgi:hypothetical protein
MIYLSLIFEDALSESVMYRMIKSFNNKFELGYTYSGNGFGYLKSNIRGFNQASKASPHFMLTDLDNYSCPLELITDWVNFPINPNFIFRIAVKEVESWLLADLEGLSNFLNVSKTNFPLSPDILIDPKSTLIQLAKRSKIRRIREEIVPLSNASIGPNYNGCLSEFVLASWNIPNAVTRSESLRRAIQKLENFNG